MKKRVADIIVDILVEHGITDSFCVVGGGAMFLDNALALNEKMNKVFNHHEQASAMAADAYARLSGKMAAVFVTSGPGALNTLTGVVGAWQDSLPMIIISGQVRYEISVPQSGLPLRYRGIQEYEIVPTVRHMTKYAIMLTDPLSVKRELCKAINIAMEGRRGPVWIDVPMDIQNAEIETSEMYNEELYEKPVYAVDYDALSEILANAKRPCILAGSGIRSANVMTEFRKFVDDINIPVVGGAWVADSFFLEHELYVGMSGNVGSRSGNFVLQNADVILVLGNSLGFRQTGFNQAEFAPNAKIIMVDIDEAESLKPGLTISLFIHKDLKSFFEEYHTIPAKNIERWKEYCRALKREFSLYEGACGIDMKERVNSYYFWKCFSEKEPGDSVLALGNNTANTAKLQIGVNTANQRVITNYACGSMGYDLPAAIGASVASGKNVICVTGDGSIMMNLQELQTIVYNELPISIIVFSNDGYAAIRNTCKNFFKGVYIGCSTDTGISFPDFHNIADTFGFKYILCETNEDVEQALEKFLGSKERTFMEVKQLMENPVIPRVMSRLDQNGKMISSGIHDMYPFLSENEMQKWMISEVE